MKYLSRFSLLFALASCAISTAWAQPAAVVDSLFAAMRRSDTASMRTLFWPEARLERLGADDQLSVTTVETFLRSIGSLPRGFADERVGPTTVRVDGPLATAWVPYGFFAGGKFHHCGTNAFTLRRVRSSDAWRIHAGIYTDRAEGCPELATAAVIADLDSLLNRWHRAAATADEDQFFGTMSADGIYLGTDAGERWVRDSMAAWAAPYFQRESAWAFTPRERHWQLSADGQTAWFDEHLDSWMGVVRGSGVLTQVVAASGEAPSGKTRWELRHYNLAVAVPNDRMDAVRVAIDSTAVPRG